MAAHATASPLNCPLRSRPRAGAAGVPRAASGALPPAYGPRPARQLTATRQASEYWDNAAKQQRREQRLEEEQRRAQHGGGSVLGRSSGATPLIPAGMRNLGNTCYLNAVLQARVWEWWVCGRHRQGHSGLLRIAPLSPGWS